ncbi:MAG: hypothetical protein MJZ66_09540 [Bacteroidales bacterium]|nr:hypothetical protein [Bacteroidales bacterium]
MEEKTISETEFLQKILDSEAANQEHLTASEPKTLFVKSKSKVRCPFARVKIVSGPLPKEEHDFVYIEGLYEKLH